LLQHSGDPEKHFSGCSMSNSFFFVQILLIHGEHSFARGAASMQSVLGQPPRRRSAIHTVSVEKSVEKAARLPRCYEHSECFSGLHHRRATFARQHRNVDVTRA
jgi:hypothetical protein